MLRHRGFTLIELLIVISIIALLSTVVLASLSTARRSARDAQRMSELREMQTALELYYSDFQRYPDGDGAGDGSWDTPGNGTFISALVDGRYLGGHLHDPLVNDSAGNLRYYRFAAGTADCPFASGAFYVLGVADMETSDGAHTLSPGWTCPDRDFGEEMEFVIGKFEK
jgi:prepilin-type N-terminal cleavage/methylation domain-containing protein